MFDTTVLKISDQVMLLHSKKYQSTTLDNPGSTTALQFRK
jgi:hypothetical protein